MLFKDISYLELWQPLWLMEQNHLCNFSRVHNEEQFVVKLNFRPYIRRYTSPIESFEYSNPLIIFLLIIKICVFGAQRNRLIQIALLSTPTYILAEK